MARGGEGKGPESPSRAEALWSAGELQPLHCFGGRTSLQVTGLSQGGVTTCGPQGCWGWRWPVGLGGFGWGQWPRHGSLCPRPASLDALVFSRLAPLMKAKLPNGKLQQHLKSLQNLCNYCTSILSLYFPWDGGESHPPPHPVGLG